MKPIAGGRPVPRRERERTAMMKRRDFLLASGRLGCRSLCEDVGVCGRLSRQVGALARWLCAGWHHRHPGASDRAISFGENRPAVHHREQGRRRQQSRGRSRARGAGRRLHRAAGQSGERHQRDALQEAVVQLRPRHRAGRRPHARAERHGGQQRRAGEDGQGVHRLRQSQPGQGQHGVVRQRHVGASCPANCSWR